MEFIEATSVKDAHTQVARTNKAQSTIEAAFLLPVVMLIFLLILQPICILYTKSIMESAVSGAIRILMTWDESREPAEVGIRSYILRRLHAVPEISLFHEGGEQDWNIEINGSETSKNVSITIMGHVRPIPLLKLPAKVFCRVSNDGCIELVSKIDIQNKPSWKEGTYHDWIQIWEK